MKLTEDQRAVLVVLARLPRMLLTAADIATEVPPKAGRFVLKRHAGASLRALKRRGLVAIEPPARAGGSLQWRITAEGRARLELDATRKATAQVNAAVDALR